MGNAMTLSSTNGQVMVSNWDTHITSVAVGYLLGTISHVVGEYEWTM